MKLISIKESPKTDKKFLAVFENEGRKKSVHFGAAGMQDYTITHDKEQRARYRVRHIKDLRTQDPTRAGYLSYYILWGDSTSLRTNITNYKKMFNL